MKTFLTPFAVEKTHDEIVEETLIQLITAVKKYGWKLKNNFPRVARVNYWLDDFVLTPDLLLLDYNFATYFAKFLIKEKRSLLKLFFGNKNLSVCEVRTWYLQKIVKEENEKRIECFISFFKPSK